MNYVYSRRNGKVYNNEWRKGGVITIAQSLIKYDPLYMIPLKLLNKLLQTKTNQHCSVK